MYKLDTQFENGYKIPSGHFKLGSKLHLSDFYYARVMFQNSFFSNRFAFIVTRYILESGMFANAGKKLALIGYGKYSEPLLDKIQKLLRKNDPTKKIELEFVDDRTSGRTIKNNPEINSSFDFIIIIPIASTLSTAGKIIESLEKHYKILREQILSPLLCPLTVMDEKSNATLNNLPPDKEGFIKIKEEYKTNYYSFNWKEIDFKNKLIKFQLFNGDTLTQKYFIPVLTQWHPIYDCKICFPDNAKEELPIINTDRVSVSPNILLSTSFPFSKVRWPVTVESSYHNYDNYRFSNKTYLHFISPRIFLDVHSGKIREWLKEDVRREPMFQGMDFHKVTLLAPEGNLNSSFPSYVNEHLFFDKANVIQFNIKKDYIENYTAFYGNNLERTENVFYVDDLLTLGNSFSTVNNYVKMVRKDHKGIDGIIILISRADNHIIEKIKERLNKYDCKNVFIFIQFNVPDVAQLHMECPIDLAHWNYLELAESSNLDTIKAMYLERHINLRRKEQLEPPRQTEFIRFDSRLNVKPVDRIFKDTETENWAEKFNQFSFKHRRGAYPKNFVKFLITHILYSIPDLPLKCACWTRFEDSFLEEIYGELRLHWSYSNNKEQDKQKIKEYLIKILSLPPFTNYQHIRNFIMRAMINEIEIVFNNIHQYPEKFSHYRTLKLLIKRLALLKSSYLIQLNFLQKLHSIHNLIPAWKRNKFAQERGVFQENCVSLINTYTKPYREYIKSLHWKNELAHEGTKKLMVTFAGLVTKLRKLQSNEGTADIFNEGNTATIVNQVKYLCQLIINTEYISNTFKEFEYFVTTCINEVIFGTEVQAVKLEEFFQSIVNVEGDFRHLKRITLLMNDGIFEDALRRIKKLKSNEYSEIIEYLNREKKSYEFEPLFRFLKITESKDYISPDIPFSVFLRAWLHLNQFNEGMEATSRAPNIATEVDIFFEALQSFFPIGFKPEISLTVAYKTIPKENSQDDFAYTFHSSANKKDPEISGFVYKMLRGIRMHVDGPLQTIFETFYKDDRWETLKGEYYSEGSELLAKQFQEFNPNEYKHFIFIRVAKVFPLESEVSSTPQAVLALRFKEVQCGTFVDTNILRYILLLRRELSKFISINSENDSFRSYVEARKEIKLLSHFRHELRENKLAIDSFLMGKEEMNTARAIIDASFNQVFLAEEFQKFHNNGIREKNNSRFPLQQTSLEELVDIYSETLNTFLQASFGDGPVNHCRIKKELTNTKILLNVNFDAIGVIMTEIFKNMKCYLARVNRNERFCYFKYYSESEYNYLEIGNGLGSNIDMREKTLESFRHRKQQGGVDLISTIYHFIFDRNLKIYPDTDKNIFIYKFQLNSYVTD